MTAIDAAAHYGRCSIFTATAKINGHEDHAAAKPENGGGHVIIAVVGDTHGNMAWVCNSVIPYAVEQGAEKLVQVGDFGFVGMGPHQDMRLQRLTDALDAAGIDLHFLPGNHEDHAQLALMAEAAPLSPDGHYQLTPRIFYTGRVASWEWDGVPMAAVGGAVSIDREWCQQQEREYGLKSWWPEEILSLVEIDDAKAIGPVDILFSHDAPADFPIDGLIPDLDSAANRQVMTDIGRALTPRIWRHGHYHRRLTYQFHHDRGDCKVIALDCDGSTPEGNVSILDLATVGAAA